MGRLSLLRRHDHFEERSVAGFGDGAELAAGESAGTGDGCVFFCPAVNPASKHLNYRDDAIGQRRLLPEPDVDRTTYTWNDTGRMSAGSAR
jgi:hypothetical protein